MEGDCLCRFFAAIYYTPVSGSPLPEFLQDGAVPAGRDVLRSAGSQEGRLRSPSCFEGLLSLPKVSAGPWAIMEMRRTALSCPACSDVRRHRTAAHGPRPSQGARRAGWRFSAPCSCQTGSRGGSRFSSRTGRKKRRAENTTRSLTGRRALTPAPLVSCVPKPQNAES